LFNLSYIYLFWECNPIYIYNYSRPFQWLKEGPIWIRFGLPNFDQLHVRVFEHFCIHSMFWFIVQLNVAFHHWKYILVPSLKVNDAFTLRSWHWKCFTTIGMVSSRVNSGFHWRALIWHWKVFFKFDIR
jgi:hypothetical protein